MGSVIKNVLLNGTTADISIEGGYIKEVGKDLASGSAEIIDGTGKAAIPGMVNCHTHSAMTLFRGWGDDMPLERWLGEKIWPAEAKMTEEDVYRGAKLACLEMIMGGTTCFNDSYWHTGGTVRAARDMGMRGFVGPAIMDLDDDEKLRATKADIVKLHRESLSWGDTIKFALTPHSIYTCSTALLQWITGYAKENGLPVHLHLGETRTEHDNCVAKYGLTPVRYLQKAGVLFPGLMVAHCLWLDDEEVHILGDHGVKVAHNPASNLKLASGYAFKYEEMKAAGVEVGIGTDGCASSNNLDMFEAARLASLLQKGWRGDPLAMPAAEALACATVNGASILGIKAGKTEAGYLADLCLIDLNRPELTPGFDLASNLIYSANGSCVDTVICNGRVIMRGRKVPGAEEIMTAAAETAYRITR